MPHVKLIKVHRNLEYHDYDYEDHYHYDYNETKFFHDSISPWQEITDEELETLKSVKGALKGKNYFIVVLEDITSKEKIDTYIDDVKAFIKEQELKELEAQKKRLEAKKKREQKAKEKEAAKKQREIEYAKKFLEKNGIKVE